MLNLTATERMRASVTQDDGSSRLVTFNVGVAIKQTLENLQLQFILSAPEDQSMQQELDKMGEGQRSQIAVTMLVTGMYLNMSDVGGGGKKPSLDMGAALNSFLQSEINNIAGSALKSVDITLGMEQYDQNGTGSGGERTDFSFRFAKRFYTTGSVSYWADVFRPDRMSRRTVAAVHRQRFDRIPSRRQRNPLHQALPRQELRESAGRRDHRNRCRYRPA